MTSHLLLSVSTLALLCSPLGANAQANDSSEIIELAPIIVTGSKRGQDVLAVPAQVESVTGTQITDNGIRTVGELDRVFPGVAIDERSSRVYSNFTVRGQSSLDWYNPSVQLYIDDLPQDAGTLAQTLPAGVESVELLYGPQGTLYGKGALGGVINVETTQPGEGDSAQIVLDASTGGYGVTAMTETQVGSDLWADIAFSAYDKADAFTTSETGDDIGGTQERFARLRLRYAPIDSAWDVLFTAQNGDLESQEEQFVQGTDLDGRVALPFPSEYEQEASLFGLVVANDLGWGEFKSITSYQNRFFDRTIFGAYTPEWQETLTQEFRLSITNDDAFDYVVGASASLLDFKRDAFGTISQQDITSYALFGDVTYHASDRLDLSAGLRYDHETTDATAIGGVALDDTTSSSSVSPKLALSYAASENLRLYGLMSTGFKPGGFTRTATTENISYTYDSQDTRNAEVGMKYRSDDDSLEASVAGYYTVNTDYQMFVGTPPSQYLQNVGEVTSKGIDATVRINRDTWGIVAGVGWNNTIFTGYDNPLALGDLTDNRVPYAPKWTAQLMLDRTFNMSNGTTLTPRLGATYQSKIWFDEGNTIGQDDYMLMNAGVRWMLNDGTEIDIYVNNLTDQVYTNYGFDGSGFGSGDVYQVGAERELGIRLSRSF